MNDFIFRYIKASFIISAIISPVYLFFNNPLPLIIGTFFGAAIRCLIFKLSAIDLDKTLNKYPEKAKSSAKFNYIKRFLFYGLALTVARFSPYLNIYTCAIGLITLTWAIHILNFIDIYNSNKTNQKWFQ